MISFTSQGAFGSVRLAYKLEDRELVVTKFIIVAKVGSSKIIQLFFRSNLMLRLLMTHQ